MDYIELKVSQKNGTFTAPPALQQVKKGDDVKWVADAKDDVKGFAITFEEGTPFYVDDDPLFFFQTVTAHGDIPPFDTQGRDGQKAVQKGIFHYVVTATAASDGKTWISGRCELHVN